MPARLSQAIGCFDSLLLLSNKMHVFLFELGFALTSFDFL
jgi:hypothetical protein